jgi:hypothetical protein
VVGTLLSLSASDGGWLELPERTPSLHWMVELGGFQLLWRGLWWEVHWGRLKEVCYWEWVMWPSIRETEGLSRGRVVVGFPSWCGGGYMLAVLGCGSSWGQWEVVLLSLSLHWRAQVLPLLSVCCYEEPVNMYVSVALVRGQLTVRPGWVAWPSRRRMGQVSEQATQEENAFS